MEPVSAHDLAQRGEIRRTAGRSAEDVRDLAEVVSTQDAGGDDRKLPCVDIAHVVELVDDASGDDERLARTDVGANTFDRPLHDTLEPIDRLLVRVVAVSSGDLRAGGNFELEHRDRSVRLLALDQEPNRQLPPP